MKVYGKDGQEHELLNPAELSKLRSLVIKLKHPTYVQGVLTTHIIASPASVEGFKPDGEWIEVVTPEVKPDEQIIEKENKDE